MYGLIKKEHLEQIAETVCDVLGHGTNRTAIKLLMETAGAETNRGLTKDTSINAGMGITQIDRLPFKDIKDRCREVDKKALKIYLDIDIDLVEWEHLRYNPLLCMIFTRLKYKKIPDLIPDNAEDRADYWKIHYNTVAGKGTIKHYLDAMVV
jgi:hypothetical protein